MFALKCSSLKKVGLARESISYIYTNIMREENFYADF